MTNDDGPLSLSSNPNGDPGLPVAKQTLQEALQRVPYEPEAGAVAYHSGLPVDTDARPESPHHTLGSQPHQAADGFLTNKRLRRLETYVKLIEESMAQVVGAITLYAGTTINDDNWLMCDGAAYPRAAYPELFAVIGTRFQSSMNPGPTMFRVPMLQGAFPLGAWEDEPLGTEGGMRDNYLHINNLPNHSHTIPSHAHSIPNHAHTISARYLSTTQTGGEALRINDVGDVTGGVGTRYLATTSLDGGGFTGTGGGGNTGNTGGGNPITNMPPFLALNYVIRAKPWVVE